MAGKSAEYPALGPEDFAPMFAFMESFNNDLAESGNSSTLEGWTPRSTRGEFAAANDSLRPD
jgi:hypothetical protein